MAIENISVKVSVAWWFRWLYVPAVYAAVYLFKIRPSEKSIEVWVRRAVRFK